MNELCVRFPMVAAHNGASVFAIAHPEAEHDDARAAATAATAPVAIYHLSTGVKTHALVLDGGGSGAGGGGMNPLAPMAEVRSSEPTSGACAFSTASMPLSRCNLLMCSQLCRPMDVRC
jgi:hypothetical protein